MLEGSDEVAETPTEQGEHMTALAFWLLMSLGMLVLVGCVVLLVWTECEVCDGRGVIPDVTGEAHLIVCPECVT